MAPPLYVRVKRKNTTIFLNVEKSDCFLGVKAKIAAIIDTLPTSIKLFAGSEAGSADIQDSAFVDSFVESDAVLFMVLKKEGSETFEEIDVPAEPTKAGP